MYRLSNYQPRARSWQQWKWWWLLVGILLLGSGCLPVTRLRIIVPDRYHGPLIVRYECPDGDPVRRYFGQVVLTFRTNGTACVRESYADVFRTAGFEVEQVQTESGNATIPWVIDVTNAHGVGFLTLGYSEIQNAQGVNEASFTEYWVGDLDSWRSISATETFVEQRAVVYEQLGVSRDMSLTQPQPVPTP